MYWKVNKVENTHITIKNKMNKVLRNCKNTTKEEIGGKRKNEEKFKLKKM